VIIAAALCPAPPLLIPGLTGAAEVAADLREACQTAVDELIASQPDVVVVVGVGEETRTWPVDEPFDVAAFAPGLDGKAKRGELPASLQVGASLLARRGHRGERLLQSVADAEPVERCSAIGAGLAGPAERTALLVLGDGSACRDPKAPGYFDHRSAAFDAVVEQAVRAGDLGALLRIDPDLARELMATGRPAWQVLAGAMNDGRLAAEIRYCDDPFGVAYLVASLRVEPPLA
jgi:hypothetical protein